MLALGLLGLELQFYMASQLLDPLAPNGKTSALHGSVVDT